MLRTRTARAGSRADPDTQLLLQAEQALLLQGQHALQQHALQSPQGMQLPPLALLSPLLAAPLHADAAAPSLLPPHPQYPAHLQPPCTSPAHLSQPLQPITTLSEERDWDQVKVRMRAARGAGRHAGQVAPTRAHTRVLHACKRARPAPPPQDYGPAHAQGPAQASPPPAAAARRKSKGKQGGGKGGAGGGAKAARPRTCQERYLDVEAFWASLRPEQRRELLRVPVATLLQGGWARAGDDASSNGAAAADDIWSAALD